MAAPAPTSDETQANGTRIAVVAVFQLALFGAVAFRRYVDGDEGSYLAAAALVYEGELPYVDFLYPQTPLLPYVYGAWALLTGESWYAARLLSVVFAAATGALLYRYLERRRGSVNGTVGTALYATSVLVLAWYPLVKTYALSTLLLFGAFVLVDRRWVPPTHWAASGVLLGLATSIRLLFVSAAAVMLGYALTRGRSSAGLLFVGLLVGLVPTLAFFGLDPSRFVFANVGIHGERSDGGLVGDVGQKIRVVENVLGIGTPGGGVPQVALLVAAAAGTAAAAAANRRFPLALALAATLAIVSILPTPTYPQYFCTAVPFAVAGVLDRRLRGRATVALVAAAGVYVATGLGETLRLVRSFPDQRIDSVEAVVGAIEARTEDGEVVISSWPGYLFGTSAKPFPGLENDFSPHNAASMSGARARDHHLATARAVEEAIARGETRIVVVKMWHDLPPIPRWDTAARRGGYRVVETVAPLGRAEVGEAVRIYERAR